jgi:hypothetical protein
MGSDRRLSWVVTALAAVGVAVVLVSTRYEYRYQGPYPVFRVDRWTGGVQRWICVRREENFQAVMLRNRIEAVNRGDLGADALYEVRLSGLQVLTMPPKQAVIQAAEAELRRLESEETRCLRYGWSVVSP